MTISKNGTVALVCATVLAVGVVAGVLSGHRSEAAEKKPAAGRPAESARAATSLIKDFSSTGGNPQNKSGRRDIMYLVKTGDKITFTVKAEGAEKCEWQVNKKIDKKAKSNSFSWTVPNEKGIWEIHLMVTGSGKEAHQEWVVSTLPKAEAPDFFDYFADKRFKDRKEPDPWGRRLPEWVLDKAFGEIDVSRGYVGPPAKGPSDDEGSVTGVIHCHYTHPYNTWKFRWMVPKGPHYGQGGWTAFRYCFLHYPGCGDKPFYYVREPGSHCYFGPHAHAFDHDKGFSPIKEMWYNAMVIQDKKNNFYSFINGHKEFKGNSAKGKICTGISIRMHHYRPDKAPKGKIFIDCLEIYKDKTLFPKKPEPFTPAGVDPGYPPWK
jgi:hypothetical protein